MTKPRLLLCCTGSSLIRASRHTAESFGSPLMPNCTMKPLDHPEKARVVEKAVLDEVVEAIGAVRRPVAMDLDDEGAFAGVELRLVDRRRLFLQGRRIAEALAPGRDLRLRSEKQNAMRRIMSSPG